MSLFRKAVKQSAKLRLAIMGPSGSGKTYSALAIAAALAGDKPIAVIDTENGSAAKYADRFAFDVAEMHAPFHPDKFIEAIQEATAAGYGVLIIDSLSHAWSGTGGVLDLVDEAAKRSKSGNTYMAWKEGTPIHNKLIDAIVQSGVHIIVTMRSKTEYVLVANDRGKQEPKKVGMAPVQRDNTEYEFDVVFDMDIENNAIVSKSRCPALTGRVIAKPGAQVATILNEWLSGEPAQAQATAPAITADTQPVASDNPFDDTTPYFVHAWHKLTGKEYDLVQWTSSLHKSSDGPATAKQYQYLSGLVDTLTANQHGYVLSVLCQSEIAKSNMPGKKMAGALLKLIAPTVKGKDEQGNEVDMPNPDYRPDIADMLTAMAKQSQAA